MLWKAASDFCEIRSVILAKSENDFGKIGVWFCENQLVMLWKAASDFCENRSVILAKSENDFVKIGVWFWIDKFLLKIRLYHKSFYIHYLIQYLLFFYFPRVILHELKGLWKRWYETGLHPFLWQDCMRQDCIHFLTRWYETGLHPFLRQDGVRQDCIHFYGKIVWGRTASIFMTRLYETGLHPFLWQDGWDRTAFIFMTSHHKTGTHPSLWQAIIRPVLIHFYVKPA